MKIAVQESASVTRFCSLQLTELHDDFSEIIWMSRPDKEADIAHLALILGLAPEDILLDIANTLQEEANSEQDDSGDIASGTKVGLVEPRDSRAVQDSNGKRHRPDPKHLEYPKSEEGKEFVSFVIKSIVFPSLEDAKEEKARQSGTPGHDEQGVNNLTSIMVARERESDDGKDDEIGATSKVCKAMSSDIVPVQWCCDGYYLSIYQT